MTTQEYREILFKDAREIAQKAPTFMSFRHGAILIKNNIVISCGYNHLSINKQVVELEKMLMTKLTFDFSVGRVSAIHAEMDCFFKLNFHQKTIRNSILFVYGESKAGNIVKSRPCSNCMRLIEFMGIRRVVWSDKRKTLVVENL